MAKTATSQNITGLTNATSYTFTVKSVDTTGNKSSGTTVTRAPADTTAPANASVLNATAGSTQISLSWTNPTDADFNGVEISWTPTGGSPAQPLTVAKTATSQNITGLTNATSYTFTVKSVDTTGNKSSGTTLLQTPNAPVGVSATIGTLTAVVGGTFNNGTSNMTVSSFHMSTYEITQAQYTTVTGNSPSSYLGDTSRPVESVTWYDAAEFCNKLSDRDGLSKVYTITGRTPANGYPITSATVTMTIANSGYRLPTEAEWEFAARGGNLTHGYTYSGSNTQNNVAWWEINSQSRTHPVGTKAANELGLYDMTGNVAEWCWDWYADYPSGAQNDYVGPAPTTPPGMNGPLKAFRGASWNDGAMQNGYDEEYTYTNPVNFRTNPLMNFISLDSPDHRDSTIGLRVVSRP